MVSFPASAQDKNVSAAEAEVEKIIPLLKMTKPELRIVKPEQPNTKFEDVVIAQGKKNSKNPVICKELIVKDFGRYNNGTRIKKTQTYCNLQSRWDAKQFKTQRAIDRFSGL